MNTEEISTQKDSAFFNIKSPEMRINMREQDIPPITSAEFLDFANMERKKCQEGVNINGQFIVPSLYYDLNYHLLAIDLPPAPGQSRPGRMLTKPTLRDNGWIIHNDYYQATVEQKLFIVAGSRQLGKTDVLVSLTCRELFCFDEAEVLGLFSIGADKDTFNKKFQIAITDKTNFLVIPNIDKDLSGTEIRFGITQKNNEPIILSRLYTYLTKEGKNTQAGAGKSATFYFHDEIARTNMRETWEAVKPALLGTYGYRCAPFMAFTGGEVEKSKDAINLFMSPQANNVLEFSNEGKQTGKFISGCYRSDFKKQVPLTEYLGLPATGELASMTIAATDFEKANATLDAELDAKRSDKDPNAVVKHKMFYPRTLEEMSLSAVESPFKQYRLGLKKHQDWLYENKPGTAYDIYRKPDGTVDVVLSDKTAIANFPHNDNDVLDAPLIIYDKPINRFTQDLNIGGLDIYHVAKSESSPSLGALYILRRTYGSLTDAFQDTIVAGYVARPERTQDFLVKTKLILDYYQAKMLHESTNDMVLGHFDVSHQAEQYLAKAWSLIQEVSPNSKARSTYGVPATPSFQRAWMERILSYISEVIGQDATGNPIYGYTRILDPLLIEEMLQYTESLNVDRIVAFGHVLLYNHNLAKNFQPHVDTELEIVTDPYRRHIYGLTRTKKVDAAPHKKNPFFR